MSLPALFRRRRVVRGLLVASAVVVLVGAALTDRWFVRPDLDDPGPPGSADAIFVLGGGGDRVPYGVDLARTGVATEVVFASPFVDGQGPNGSGVWAARPCNTPPRRGIPDGVTFECVEPDPATTRGEARLLADLADERGWETVVVVVSTDQVTRARRLIGRCWDGELRVTAVDHDQAWPIRAVYEWGAGMKATLLRGC